MDYMIDNLTAILLSAFLDPQQKCIIVILNNIHRVVFGSAEKASKAAIEKKALDNIS